MTLIYNAGLAFAPDGALMVNPNTPTVQFGGGKFNTDQTGYSYVDYTNSPSATNTYRGGIAFAENGSAFCTTAAVGSSTVSSMGLAVTGGKLHITFVRPTNPVWVNGFLCNSSGVVYCAGPTETQAFWFRYGIGITVTGSGVSTWADQSGNARDLLQGTDTNRPALQSDNSILFDGVDNYLKAGAFTLGQPSTIYLLLNPVSFTEDDFYCCGDAGTNLNIIQQNGTPKIRFRRVGTLIAEVTQSVIGSYGIVCAVANGASSGMQVNNNAQVTGDGSTTTWDGFTLGASGTPSNYSNIRVKEIIGFAAAHDATAITKNITYLNAVSGGVF